MQINTALILCAGLGKRLNPLTLKTPKPLLKLDNVTILERCINIILKSGAKKIFLNTFHLGNQIFEFIKNCDLAGFNSDRFDSVFNDLSSNMINNGLNGFYSTNISFNNDTIYNDTQFFSNSSNRITV